MKQVRTYLDEPERHFQRDTEVLVPNIAGWRREPLSEILQDQRFEVVPDWVCEILSVSTAGIDREVEMPVYARYGVQHAWLVDLRAQTVLSVTAGRGRVAQRRQPLRRGADPCGPVRGRGDPGAM